MKILLTGATGFIGSNIAKILLDNDFEIYATYRSSSSFEKCIEFKEKLFWISTDTPEWKDQIRSIKPDQLIHVAWSGTDIENRNNCRDFRNSHRHSFHRYIRLSCNLP